MSNTPERDPFDVIDPEYLGMTLTIFKGDDEYEILRGFVAEVYDAEGPDDQQKVGGVRG